MVILGISDKADSSVTLIMDGKITFAINEERLTRIKLQSGFPKRSLIMALDFLRINKLNNSIDGIAVAGLLGYEDLGYTNKTNMIQKILGIISYLKLGNIVMGTKFGVEISKVVYRAINERKEGELKSLLREYGIDLSKIKVYDHHLCHAYSAYFTSGFNDCLTITIDASGDGYCSRVYKCNNGQMTLLHSIPFYHSIGYYYTIVTFILGFKTGQQGKVTGLAACGDPEKTLHIFEKKIPYNSKRMIFENCGKYYLFEMPRLKKELEGFSREDISAGIQRHLENSVVKYIKDILSKYKYSDVNIALAGGLFANVLLNRAIARIDGVNQVFIHPHMGDGGLASGAAFAMYKESNANAMPYKMPHAYLGCEFSDEEVRDALDSSGLGYKLCDDIEKEVARLIAAGKVVARYEGRMEYGPRALGHRSILYHARDSTVNAWLNARLRRSEFMPFAPAVLEEYADLYFISENQYHPEYFMTIVSDTTEKCKNECPAIVHVDGTARPQIVSKLISPSYYRIIDEYRKLTGIPVIVNTSFNMHEEPIVDSPLTAVNAFTRGRLDYLAMDNYLVEKSENYHNAPDDAESDYS